MTQNRIAKHSLKAALIAAALIGAQPAWANTIELNNFWAGTPDSYGYNSGYGTVNVNYTGGVWYDSTQGNVSVNVNGGSGGFKTYDLTTDPNRNSPFQTFCVDIFHDFNFAVQSVDYSPTSSPSGLSTYAINNLDRLYTMYHSKIDSTSIKSSTAVNESAFQLAIWAIVNDGAAINQSGVFDLNGGPIQFSNDSTGSAISTAKSWLNSLANATSNYNAQFLMVQNQGPANSWGAQDVVYFTLASPVPEPQTYAMLLAGLGLVGFLARRRKNHHDTMNFV